MGDSLGAWRELFPRGGGVQLFGGEEYRPVAMAGLRAGTAGAQAPEMLPSPQAPYVEFLVGRESEGVEALSVGQEKVQASVVAVL